MWLEATQKHFILLITCDKRRKKIKKVTKIVREGVDVMFMQIVTETEMRTLPPLSLSLTSTWAQYHKTL